jgi:ankyrin repeat protein
MKLVRFFLALTLLSAAYPVHGMDIFTAWFKKPQTSQVEYATNELAKLDLSALDKGDLRSLLKTDLNIKKIKELIQQGANPNTANNPLHYAVRKDDAELVRLLLELGANPNHPNDMGDSAFEEARFHNNPAVIEAFLTTKTNPPIDPNIDYRRPKAVPGMPGVTMQRTMLTPQANNPAMRQQAEKIIEEFRKEKLP